RVLGDAGEPYRSGEASPYFWTAQALALGGAATLLAGGRNRTAAVGGGLMLLGASLAERVTVWRAGPASARASRP
ncbi:MAG: polysulfide reductase, partial [Candidatus Dormibacteraeota bacterium]|nr:polysulfide reductase [Candidatus Dormibacteraeota bacterium]